MRTTPNPTINVLNLTWCTFPVMTIVLDPLLCMILSGVMFFCSGFATYGCYRCYTDIEGSKIAPEEHDAGFLKRSKERYRLRLFRRRPSTVSSEATIYSVHSSEIWSRQNTPRTSFTPPPSASARLLRRSPSAFVNTSQILGWTIQEEPEPEEAADRRKSAPN